MAAIQEKSMVPTIVVGVGGTGVEIMSRLRRLIQESYGSLDSFPIVSFLSIDTDRDYKVTNTEAAGADLEDHEKHWARVTGNEVQDMLSNMSKYPWIEKWFPPELEKNVGALEAGAGQIRACGRFAFFYNYQGVRDKFRAALERVKGHDQFMLSSHGVTVVPNTINVFVVGSLSGGTGSGMLIDAGYCIRHWLQGQGSTSTTSIVPMPNAFSNISVGERVLENGYAALIELSYYSDTRTIYSQNFSTGISNQITEQRPPFDFTYLVGTKNGEVEFNLDQIREMIALNIFLDLTSDFAPHKRSIRDNISKNWLQQDQAGRGFPRSFMSFGLSSIEFPIYQVRSSLGNRLASDLVGWMLNEQSILPPNMNDVLTGDTFKKLRMSSNELLSDIASTGEAPYAHEISKWVNTLREFISTEELTKCTLTGTKVIGQENGGVLLYTKKIRERADEYRLNNLRDLGPDRRTHGAYLQRMYDNSQKIRAELRKRLTEEMYSIVSDRIRGPKYAKAFLTGSNQILLNMAEQYRRENEKTWEPNYLNRSTQFETALEEIDRIKTQYGVSKQSVINDLSSDVLTGLESSLMALIQKKSRALALEIVNELQEHITALDSKLSRFTLKLITLKDILASDANDDMLQADALKINGQKLFDRSKINEYYIDAVTCKLVDEVDNSFDKSLNRIGAAYIPLLLNQLSPLWKASRSHDDEMKLWDIGEVPDIHEYDIVKCIRTMCKQYIFDLPEYSLLSVDRSATALFLKSCNNEENKIESQLKIVFSRSKPLIELNRNILQADDGFATSLSCKVAIVGGSSSPDPAAQKIIPYLLKRADFKDVITPLGVSENHRIIFVQEVGGFSLRALEGMAQLRKSYKEWQSQMIKAKRERLNGLNVDLPIPVHTEKQAPFWDIFPDNPKIFILVTQARALGILRREINNESNEYVVRYSRTSSLGRLENIDLASSWEEAVLVLDLKDCDNDRAAVQGLIEDYMRNCDKRKVSDILDEYLNQRMNEFPSGSDSMEYKRELSVVENFAASYNLPVNYSIVPKDSNKQSVHMMPDTMLNQSPPMPLEATNDLSIDSRSKDEQQLFSFLQQLHSFNLPKDALLSSANSKGLELGLKEIQIQAVLNDFMPSELTQDEQLLFDYLTALSNLGLPDEAFDAATKSKAAQLNIPSDRVIVVVERIK